MEGAYPIFGLLKKCVSNARAGEMNPLISSELGTRSRYRRPLNCTGARGLLVASYDLDSMVA